MALQPVVDLTTRQVIAHEALLRGPAGTPWERPDTLFAAADRLGQRALLETNARRLAVNRLADLPDHHRLFINIDTLVPDIPAMPGHPSDYATRVTLEISERQPVVHNAALLEQVQHWRAMGHQIAIDDYGAGYMGAGALLALNPDILKLDRMVIAGIDYDRRRQVLVAAIARMGIDLGIQVIAEGIETKAECHAIQEAGVTLAQGYYLGHPQDHPVGVVAADLV